MTRKRNYLGGDSFPDGQPVCKPVTPGRCPKPLEGPVHPGFKGKPQTTKPKAAIKPTLVRSSQTDDLYQPVRKSKVKKNKLRKK